MNQAITTTHPPDALALAPPTPMSMIAHAVQSGASMEQLERLLALQERYEANEARKAFTAAMAAFKANPPEITKDKLVDFTSSKGRTRYRHATLGNVCGLITAGLAEHGISHAWRTEQDGRLITVTCTLTHSAGHSESTSLTGAPDDTGNKNTIQQVGSAITYLQRYTLLAATGLSAVDTDDDGTATGRRPDKVGKVYDPYAAPVRHEPAQSEPEPVEAEPPAVDNTTWQELHPKGWRSYLEALGDFPADDAGLGRIWQRDKENPALCAWAAGWITKTMREFADMEWQEVAIHTLNNPPNLEDCTTDDLWGAAAYLRRLKAEEAKKEGGAA